MIQTECFGFVGFSIWAIGIAVIAGVATYLFLRANPRTKARVDKAVDKVKDLVE